MDNKKLLQELEVLQAHAKSIDKACARLIIELEASMAPKKTTEKGISAERKAAIQAKINRSFKNRLK